MKHPLKKTLDEETFNAMQWASKLPDYSSVLSFHQSLPAEIIQEQLVLYRNRPAETAVAVATKQDQKVKLNPQSRYTVKMTVAARFHMYCKSRGIVFEDRLPYGTIAEFMKNNVTWTGGKQKFRSRNLRDWYTAWRSSSGSHVIAGSGQKKIKKEHGRI